MTTYYATHNAAGGGAGTSVGDPFTLQELFDNVTSADLGLICNTGTYTPSAQLDLDTNAGTVSARVNLRGAASDGTDDGTVATISGSSLGASTNLLAITVDFLDIANLRLTAATADNVSLTTDDTRFTNCRFDNASSDGLIQNSFSHFVQFFNCEIDNNGGFGYGGGFSTRGDAVFQNCSIHDNGSYGVRLSNNGQLQNSLVYKNGSHGVLLALDSAADKIIEIRNCTIATNTGNGVDVTSGTSIEHAVIADTILYENTGYGVDLNGANIQQFTFRRLCVHNNSTGDIDTGSFPSDTITDDPTFTSESAGSEDYTPTASALKQSITWLSGIGGTSYQWIGAMQPDTAGGGGGGPLIRGRLVA